MSENFKIQISRYLLDRLLAGETIGSVELLHSNIYMCTVVRHSLVTPAFKTKWPGLFYGCRHEKNEGSSFSKLYLPWPEKSIGFCENTSSTIDETSDRGDSSDTGFGVKPVTQDGTSGSVGQAKARTAPPPEPLLPQGGLLPETASGTSVQENTQQKYASESIKPLLVPGHTCSRHIALTESELRERLSKDSKLSACTTFFSENIALEAISRTINARSGKINKWLKKAQKGNRKPCNYSDGTPYGFGIAESTGPRFICHNVRVVLEKKDNCMPEFYILTAFPYRGEK